VSVDDDVDGSEKEDPPEGAKHYLLNLLTLFSLLWLDHWACTILWNHHCSWISCAILTHAFTYPQEYAFI
jgi:hypothetical protein